MKHPVYAVSQGSLNLIPCDTARVIRHQKVNPDPVLRLLHHMATSCIAQHLGEVGNAGEQSNRTKSK
jgi:hypothetical protein